MPLPSSGTISFQDIKNELGIPNQSPFSMITAAQGGYVAINQNSPLKPRSTPPFSIHDWYGYNHTATPPSGIFTIINNTINPNNRQVTTFVRLNDNPELEVLQINNVTNTLQNNYSTSFSFRLFTMNTSTTQSRQFRQRILSNIRGTLNDSTFTLQLNQGTGTLLLTAFSDETITFETTVIETNPPSYQFMGNYNVGNSCGTLLGLFVQNLDNRIYVFQNNVYVLASTISSNYYQYLSQSGSNFIYNYFILNANSSQLTLSGQVNSECSPS